MLAELATAGETKGVAGFAATLGAAVESVLAQQEPDGLWRSVYRGGPLHAAMGLVATNLLLPSTPVRFRQEADIVRGMLAEQEGSGGFLRFAGGGVSNELTRLCAIALELFRASHTVALGQEPALVAELGAAIERARTFVEKPAAQDEPLFYRMLAGLVHDAVHPELPASLPAPPFDAELARFFLDSKLLEGARERLSSFSLQALPAMAVLFERASERGLWSRLYTRLSRAVGLGGPEQALAELERHILEVQDRAGGWLWSVMGTTLNLLALRALGRDASHPAVQAGLAFIQGLRRTGPNGRTEQAWCNAELWDTAAACDALLAAGVEPERFRVADVVAAFQREQQPDGLWGFGLGASEGDNDTSSVVLALLAKLCRHAAPALRPAVAEMVRRCARTLIDSQQEDGGWGYSPRPHAEPYHFGRRVPGSLETMLVDASTPDVSARIMSGLLAARSSGALDPDDLRRIDAACVRAAAYFRDAQTATGSWVARWNAGYLSTPVFVLSELRAAAPSDLEPCMARARTFVLAHQNADGGWGEEVAADVQPALAGLGPSTPVQTAYALVALLASAPEGIELPTAPLRGGLAYLVAQQRAGTWENGRALYTVSFREDYFDAPLMTQVMVLTALAYHARAARSGIRSAAKEMIRGTLGAAAQLASGVSAP